MFLILWIGVLGCATPVQKDAETADERTESTADLGDNVDDDGAPPESDPEDEADSNEGEDEGPPEEEPDAEEDDESEPETSEDSEDPPPAEDAATPEDDADVVISNLPSAMDCGEVVSVSVVMRNTGTATWTRAAGYKLGALGDSDALYGPDPRVWLPEDVEVPPGETYVFDFELTAPSSAMEVLTDWQMVHEGVRWFGESTRSTVEVTCSEWTHCDPLTSPDAVTGFSGKDVSGGSFSGSGWQTTGDDDQLVIEIADPLTGSARIEIDVTNFDPHTQYSRDKHQIFNAYTSDNGSQDVFDTNEAWRNFRTGTNYGTGFKLLASPNGGDAREESRHHADSTWSPSDVHSFAVEWDASEIDLYLNDEHLQTFDYSGRVRPIQYVFIGTDNVYGAQVGPIYSNLCVTHSP